MQFPRVAINAEGACDFVMKEEANICCVNRIIKNSERWAGVVTIWDLSEDLVTNAVSHIIIYNAPHLYKRTILVSLVTRKKLETK